MTAQSASSSTEHCKPITPFLTVHDAPVYFQEDWNTGIGGGLWSTGLAMAHYFCSESARNSVMRLAAPAETKKPLRVLELGSGNGFLSVCLLAMARDYIDTLVVTDVADHLPLIEKTVAANQHLIVAADDHHPVAKIIIKEHNWGEFENNMEETFNLILGSDVAYRPYLYDPLISSLSHYSDSNTISLIGVTMSDTTPAFFVKLQKAGFSYTRLNDFLMHTNFQGTTFAIFVIRKKANVL